jgi:predicted enzyme related to lactoylglutathione lyase
MGTRTSHPPGTFSWTDLATTDAEAAKAFYTALFGWEPVDTAAGPNATYTMMRVGGHDVAALYQGREGQPTAWLSYVTVEDADATAARAKELGATLMTEAFDVLTAGRMALIHDPQGALFAVWQPGESIGAKLVNDPGSMTWNDLATPDVDQAAAFYRDLFGWRTEEVPGAEGQYWTIWNGDRTNGGMRPMQPGEPAPSWTAYFTVADLDAALARVGELGGATVAGPMQVGPGRFAAVRDPQGAVFSLYEGDIDD